MHSDNRQAVTHPIINGATYINKATGESGTVQGTSRDPQTGNTRGQLYTFNRGNMPMMVVENTQGFVLWEIESAPSKKTAEGLLTAHKRKNKTTTTSVEAE